MASEAELREVKRRHSAELLKLPGVCGVGVAKGKSGGLVIALHLNTDDPEIVSRLPKEIEGHAVEMVFSGPFKKLTPKATNQ
ncbi:MAG TPA: hypothetical protein VEI73_05935 [Candidatus Acidoferrum sp.]|nr:hypothetical protein [Candidatus Acidoferrum sp.]